MNKRNPIFRHPDPERSEGEGSRIFRFFVASPKAGLLRMTGQTEFYNSSKSVTLVELLVSLVIVSMMVLSFYSLDTFSRQQAISADRRSKVQNSLAYTLEHMSKYVQQANGNINDRGIMLFPPGNPNGFRVRVDFGGTSRWIRYSLPSGGYMIVTCLGNGCPVANEVLSAKVLRSGCEENSLLPNPLPDDPKGLYVRIDDEGSSINIGLVGRYNPLIAENRLTNPQVTMQTKIICNACSAN